MFFLDFNPEIPLNIQIETLVRCFVVNEKIWRNFDDDVWINTLEILINVFNQYQIADISFPNIKRLFFFILNFDFRNLEEFNTNVGNFIWRG